MLKSYKLVNGCWNCQHRWEELSMAGIVGLRCVRGTRHVPDDAVEPGEPVELYGKCRAWRNDPHARVI